MNDSLSLNLLFLQLRAQFSIRVEKIAEITAWKNRGVLPRARNEKNYYSKPQPLHRIPHPFQVVILQRHQSVSRSSLRACSSLAFATSTSPRALAAGQILVKNGSGRNSFDCFQQNQSGCFNGFSTAGGVGPIDGPFDIVGLMQSHHVCDDLHQTPFFERLVDVAAESFERTCLGGASPGRSASPEPGLRRSLGASCASR